MLWRKEYLDVILVLSGLLIMSAYHVFLLCRCIKLPDTTVIGYENHNKKAWVKKMLEVEAKDRNLAVSVINGTISAATFLATVSLALSSLIGGWISSSSHNVFTSSVIYGDTSKSIISVKYLSLLICFLVAFGFFLQCIVQKAVIRGSACWSVGLRAIYFATTLLLWIFGPIPMLVASVTMVSVLHILDTNKTQLYPFHQPAKSHFLFRMIGEEITTVARAFEHPERSHRDGSDTSGGLQ